MPANIDNVDHQSEAKAHLNYNHTIDDEDKANRTPLPVLRQLGLEICAAYDVPSRHGEIVIDALLDADMCGKSTHGIVRLATYLQRVARGLMAADATPMITHDTGALARADAGNGLGAVTMEWALDELTRRAGRHGIAALIIDHSNHIGALGYWSRRLAIGVPPLVSCVISDSSPRLPPTGGFDPILGNNPWSMAFPRIDGQAVVMDMANSVAAAGKIREAMKEGVDIPEGWALAPDGEPTTNAAEALQGLLLPMAGYKGYAITLAMGLITNALGQAETLETRNAYDKTGPQNLTQFAMAIDASALYGNEGPGRLQAKVEAWVSRVKASRKQSGVESIWLPGERSDILRREAMKHGIVLTSSARESLASLATSVGIQTPL